MTAEFNITIPGAEIIKRLADLETANADLLDRLKQLELTVSANAHQQDALHDRFIALERNNAVSPVSAKQGPASRLRDTDWRPYTGTSNADRPVNATDYVAVLTRDNHRNYGRAELFDWADDMLGGTIVAWRYAKEGE